MKIKKQLIFACVSLCCMQSMMIAAPRKGVKQIVCETWRVIDHSVTKMDNLITTADGLISTIDEQLPEIENNFSLIEANISIIEETLDSLSLTDDMISVIDEIKSEITTLPTPIAFAPYTITQSGSYAVTQQLDGPIVIDADYVSLSLNGNSIVASGSAGVLLNSGKHHIVIENGYISSFDSGIKCAGTAALPNLYVVIDNTHTSDCTEGIRISHCNNLVVRACSCAGGETGMHLDNAYNGVITDCALQNSTKYGMFLSRCFYTDIKQCIATAITSDSNNVYGFYSELGAGNTFNSCSAQGIKTTSGANNSAFGIALRGELATKVVSCNCEGVLATESSAYGIHAPIDYPLSLVERVPGENFSVAWTSDGHYFASGGFISSTPTLALVDVYEFAENTLTLKNNLITTDLSTTSVAWMPNNYYLAIGGQKKVGGNNVGALSVYYFNGSVLQFPAFPPSDPGTNVNSVSWSPNGQYLAIGGHDGSNGFVRVYQFTPGLPGTLTQIVALTPPASTTIKSVAWSRDGQHLAIGGAASAVSFFAMYAFDGVSLTPDVLAPPTSLETSTAIAWSPSGIYLAVVNDHSNLSDRIIIWKFVPGSPSTLTEEAVYAPTNYRIYGIDWSFHEKHLVSGGQFATVGGGGMTATYEFIPKSSASELNILSALGVQSAERIRAVSYIPGGLFLGMGGIVLDSYAGVWVDSVVLKSVMQYNVIKSVAALHQFFGIVGSNEPADSVEPNLIVNNRSRAPYSATIQHVVTYPDLTDPLDNLVL